MPLLNSCTQLISAELEAQFQGCLRSTRTTSAWQQKYLHLIRVVEIYGRTQSVTKTQKHLSHLSATKIRDLLRAVPSCMSSQLKKDAATYLYLDSRSKEIFAYRLRHNLLRGWPETVPYHWDESRTENNSRLTYQLRRLDEKLTEADRKHILEHRLPVEMFEKKVTDVKRWNKVQLAKYVNSQLNIIRAKKTVSRYCRLLIPEFAYRERLRSEQIALLQLEQLRAKLNTL